MAAYWLGVLCDLTFGGTLTCGLTWCRFCWFTVILGCAAANSGWVGFALGWLTLGLVS